MQGVDLTVIVQDDKVYSNDNNGPVVHTVVKLVDILKESLNDASYNNTEAQIILDKFICECMETSAKNSLAGRHGAHNVLLDYIKRCKDSEEMELLKKVLDGMEVLLIGQSKLMKPIHIPSILEMTDIYHDQMNILIQVLKVISVSCITNEANRQTYINNKIVNKMQELLIAYKGEELVVKEICSVFCVLTVDDDATVPFGQSHENSKLIATEGDGLKLILELCKGEG